MKIVEFLIRYDRGSVTVKFLRSEMSSTFLGRDGTENSETAGTIATLFPSSFVRREFQLEVARLVAPHPPL
jgi:hypothetical protein